MRAAIQAGDLAVVVKPRRCGCTDAMGKVFTVLRVGRAEYRGRCWTCGAITFPAGTLIAWHCSDGTREVELLKRIPPLSELEGQRTEEKLKEPA